jgi:DUF1365 family protein
MFSKIYAGRVFHQRTQTKNHRLSYNVFSILFDLDEFSELHSQFRFFSHNRFNIFSFWDKDYGPNEQKPLRSYIEKILQGANVETNSGPIRLLCYPRVFGYAFNPLSVYYCYDRDNALKAIIYEVSNTFGERHSYVIEVTQDGRKTIHQTCEKIFYVSPFIEMDCTYRFSMRPPSSNISVMINQTNDKGVLLKACFTGNKVEITNKSLLRLIFIYPLMTLKVMVGIHWEALKLWGKGLKFIPRPKAPIQPITYVKTETIS